MFHIPCRAWVFVSVFSLVFMSTVKAEVLIAGSADAIQIEADNGTLDEILGKLRAEYNLQIRTTEELQIQISGSYRGSLRKVVSRLLDRYNYVIEGKPDALSIIVVGLKDMLPAVPSVPKPVVAQVQPYVLTRSQPYVPIRSK